MKAKKVEIYKCPQCDTIFVDEQEARECCEEPIDSEEGWECGECGELYDNKDDAKECCK